ncbi:hypothetical protein [Haloarcula litorea]|uniref:hypothetical protein n=1 Tax=Haloarcula litorea TaxID=3032579 RepID=UPI0023E85FFE|nr:hypothetical protein [Halomicroarcula sp. GDY20]
MKDVGRRERQVAESHEQHRPGDERRERGHQEAGDSLGDRARLHAVAFEIASDAADDRRDQQHQRDETEGSAEDCADRSVTDRSPRDHSGVTRYDSVTYDLSPAGPVGSRRRGATVTDACGVIPHPNRQLP